MFYDFKNIIVIKGSDKEEYAKDAVTGKMVHGLKDRLTGSLRKVALEPGRGNRSSRPRFVSVKGLKRCTEVFLYK